MSTIKELTSFSISEVLDGLEKRSYSCEELVKAYIANIESKRDLNSFVLETLDKAVEEAKNSDDRRKEGKARKLEGIPVSVKDLFCTKNIRTTACSKMLENFIPSYESHVTERLFADGAIMLGKTNMDEFAMGSDNTKSYYGPVKNNWKVENGPELVPGGSSGGSAVAVSAKQSLISLGSDTGGSVRQPASFTGVIGIKPTYGRCSRWGMIAFASSLDQAGVFARSAKDAALVLESICGHDPKDSTSVDMPVPEFSKEMQGDIKGLRVGLPKEYHSKALSPEIEKCWEETAHKLEKAGAIIEEITLPNTEAALLSYYIIAPAEASSNLARYDGVRYGLRVAPEGCSLDEMYEHTRQQGFGDEVKRRIIMGTYVLSAGYYEAYYKKAQKIRSLVVSDFKKVFQDKIDVILTPTTPTTAFPLGQKMDVVSSYLNDIFTVPTSLAGLPGISVPVALSQEGLPLGMQLIGKYFNESLLLKVASVLEVNMFKD